MVKVLSGFIDAVTTIVDKGLAEASCPNGRTAKSTWNPAWLEVIIKCSSGARHPAG
jgi:hypothetical protein